MKILFTIFVLFSSSLLAVSTTDKLAIDETSFYDQTSGAELVGCNIEFTGVDNNLNILNGSFGINYFENQNTSVLLFKLIHYQTNEDASETKMYDINSAFFELNNYLSNDLIELKNDKESFLAFANPLNFVENGLISDGDKQSFKVIVDYKARTLDKVFEFDSLNRSKILELLDCSIEMLNNKF